MLSSHLMKRAASPRITLAAHNPISQSRRVWRSLPQAIAKKSRPVAAWASGDSARRGSAENAAAMSDQPSQAPQNLKAGISEKEGERRKAVHQSRQAAGVQAHGERKPP